MALNTRTLRNQIQSEDGNAQLFLLLGVCILAFHFTNSYTIIAAPVPPVVKYALLVIAGLCILASAGCLLHLWVYGCINMTTAKRQIKTKLADLSEMIELGEGALRQHLANDRLRSRVNAGHTNCSLTKLKIFLTALQRRYIEVSELVQSGTRADIIAAYDKLHRRLSLTQDILDSLLTADPMPPVAHDEIRQKFDVLLEQVNEEASVLAA